MSVLELWITLGWCQPKRKRQSSSRCMATPTEAGNPATIASFYISCNVIPLHWVLWGISKCFCYLSSLETHSTPLFLHLDSLSETIERNDLHDKLLHFQQVKDYLRQKQKSMWPCPQLILLCTRLLLTTITISRETCLVMWPPCVVPTEAHHDPTF